MRFRGRYLLPAPLVLAAVGTAILWPANKFGDKVAAIPVGSSREEVYSKLGKPFALMPIHNPDNVYDREIWVYPGPWKLSPKFCLSPLQVSLVGRSAGPKVYFYHGQVEGVSSRTG